MAPRFDGSSVVRGVTGRVPPVSPSLSTSIFNTFLCDDFDDGSRLRSEVRDLVLVGRVEWFSAGKAHQSVAVRRRDEDVFPEQFFLAEPIPLRRELRTASKDALDASVFDALSVVEQSHGECFEQFRSCEHALHVVIGSENRHGLIDNVSGVSLRFFGLAFLEQLDDPTRIEVNAETDSATVLSEMFDGQS